MPLVIEPVDAPTDHARALAGELDAELSGPYAPDQRHGLSVARIFQPGVCPEGAKVSFLKGLLWVGGGLIGTAAGVAVAVGVGAFSQWRLPDDPSAGSAPIIVLLTAPLGLLVGVACGAWCGDRWTKRSRTLKSFDVVTRRPGGAPR